MSAQHSASVGALLFGRAPGGPTTTTLTEAIGRSGALLDAHALLPRVVGQPPNHAGETPWVGIVCKERQAPVTAREVASVTETSKRARCPVEAASLLKDALGQALARALTGVRRVAVMTGGGVDSSGLLALAVAWARETGGSVVGVALDFAADGDDRPHLRALEQHLRCPIIRMAPEEAEDAFLLYRGVDAAPMIWPTAVMEVALMRRAKADGAECILSGVGGDHLFDGDPRSLADRARRGDLHGALRAARRLRGFVRPRSPALSWVGRPWLASLLPYAARRKLASRPRFRPPSWAGPVLVDWLRHRREAAFSESYASARRAQAEAARVARVYREHLVWIRHQESAASGLPRLDPYLDPLLVAAVSALDRSWLLFGDERRGLFREAMRGALPESLRTRQDKASFEPAIDRFVEAARAFDRMRELADGSALAALGIVDRARYQEAFERFAVPQDRDANEWVSLWPAICVEAFVSSQGNGDAR